jgi:GNAT superfamily N-acetyltransferase
MTRRFAEVEAELQRRSRGMTAEVFPELEFVSPATPGTAAAAPGVDRDAMVVEDLGAVLRIAQVMEDVWMACELDRWWNHPLNLGWINLFARWATAPTFRMWWPVLGPMFSPGFRKFLDERFPMPPPAGTPEVDGACVMRTSQRARVIRLEPEEAPGGLAFRWWKERSTQPRRWEGKALYQNLLLMPRVGQAPLEMQVGIVAVTEHGDHAGWTSNDFFVPPSLWGAGIGWYFLDELLNQLAGRFTHSYVVVKAPPVDAQHALALDDRRSFIEQYRKIGYREQLPGDNRPGDPTDAALVDTLGLDPAVDTLLVLDFELWSRRRGR